MRWILLAGLMTLAPTGNAHAGDTRALARLFLSRLAAAGGIKPQASGVVSSSLVCVTVTRFEMRQLGWRKSVGAGCANRISGEVLGGVLSPGGFIRCTFTGSYDDVTGCAVISGCGDPVQVCLQ